MDDITTVVESLKWIERTIFMVNMGVWLIAGILLFRGRS